MFATVHLPPQGRALSRPGTEVEGERHQGVELPVRQRRRDEPHDSSLGDADVLSQNIGGLGLRNARCELLLLMCQYYTAVANGSMPTMLHLLKVS